LFSLDRRNVYHASLLDEIPWARHGFGTRQSAEWPGAEAALVTLRQIHSDRVVVAQAPGAAGEADAVITNQPGLLLTIRTADCIPILIADVRQRAVAAVHAGWRGTVLGILPKTVQAMKEQFDSRIEDLRMAAGPGIGACCFEVGPEVASEFSGLFPERSDLSARAKVDLFEANGRQLGQLGVKPCQIVLSRVCTSDDARLFHSYRRDRDKAGRMVSGIGIR
jgi:YfiH family protein